MARSIVYGHVRLFADGVSKHISRLTANNFLSVHCDSTHKLKLLPSDPIDPLISRRSLRLDGVSVIPGILWRDFQTKVPLPIEIWILSSMVIGMKPQH